MWNHINIWETFTASTNLSICLFTNFVQYLLWIVQQIKNSLINTASLRWLSYQMERGQNIRNLKRHSDGTFTSDFTHYLDKIKAKDFVEWLASTKREGWAEKQHSLLLWWWYDRTIRVQHKSYFIEYCRLHAKTEEYESSSVKRLLTTLDVFV